MNPIPARMQAARRLSYCQPEGLEVVELPVPSPGPDQILVRVEATTVSRSDCGILTGLPRVIRLFTGWGKPRRPITGSDFAGTVAAVGSAVEAHKVGDRVWGFNDTGLGSHAQFVAVSAREAVAPIPDGHSFAEAVACAEGAHYAYNFINKLALEPGTRVLVYGATGAIGSAVVQLLKHAGVEVTAVCATPYLEKVAALGADRVIDYTTTDFAQGTDRYHVVFDAVGKRTFSECRQVLLPGGVYISSELGPNGQNIPLSIAGIFTRGRRVKFPFPSNIPRSLSHMNQLMEAGAFRPLIDRSYPLSQIGEAFSYTLSGQKIGNVIIRYW